MAPPALDAAAAARARYPDVSQRLGLLLWERDQALAPEGAAADAGASSGDEPCSCAADAAERDVAARAFADFFDDPGVLGSYQVLDEVHRTQFGPSLWYAKGGAVWQASGIKQEPRWSGQRLARRGSLLLKKGHKYWRFVLRVHFARREGRPVRSHGVVFCAQDPSNYYLLFHELQGDAGPQPVRLLKVCDDTFQLLAEAPGPPDVSGGIDVEVVRAWDSLRVSYGPTRIVVRDAAHRGGQVGLLSYDNDALCVDAISCRRWEPPRLGAGTQASSAAAVRSELPTDRVLFEDVFADSRRADDVAEVVDFDGCAFGRGEWSRGGGRLRQTSNVHRTADYGGDAAGERGTMLVYRAAVRDPNVRYRAHVGGADGSVWDGFGFVFDFQSADDFWMVREDPRFGYIRLLRVCGGEWRIVAEAPTDGRRPVAGQTVDVWVQRVWRNNTEYVRRVSARVGKLPGLRCIDAGGDGGGRCGFACFAAPHFSASYLQVLSIGTGGGGGGAAAPDAGAAGAARAAAQSGGSGVPQGELVRLLQQQDAALRDAAERDAELRGKKPAGKQHTRKVAQRTGLHG